MKGPPICFIEGKYAGKAGWINTDEQPDENVVGVIVNLGRKGLKPTFVYQSSIKLVTNEKPSNYAAAVAPTVP